MMSVLWHQGHGRYREDYSGMYINFDGKSFVENVREKTSRYGLEKLQKQVLRDVLKDKSISVHGVHEGKSLMIKKLRGKKVLVVLDDVDHAEQLDALAGDPSWFKPGSRIIITTRDGEVLNSERVKWIHDANLLLNEEAICLFSRHAFGNDIPAHEYGRQSREVVRYAAGLPLTIKVLGSMFRGKNKPQWRDELARLATVPPEETLKILELSYESLEDDCKEIFLDVACFLKDWEEDEAIRMLESCGLPAKNGLRILEQKYLITLKNDNGSFIQMHDRLVEMGMNIVRREHPDEPNKHSRLWVKKEIEHVLADKSGSEAARRIVLVIPRSIYLDGLGNMKKLECLIVNKRWSEKDSAERVKQIILQHYLYWFSYPHFPNSLRYLYWYEYPHRCLPKTFEANNLVSLEMPHSNIVQLHLSGNTNIEEIPSSIGNLHNLVSLHLGSCWSLKSLPVSVCSLQHLRTLKLGFNRIEELPEELGQLECLEYLDLFGTKVKHLPNSICMLKRLKTLIIAGCMLHEKLPEDVGELESLEKLDLIFCSNLREIPSNICELKHLKMLKLYGCKRIEKLPEELGNLGCLQSLDISHTDITHLPHSISLLKGLEIERS